MKFLKMTVLLVLTALGLAACGGGGGGGGNNVNPGPTGPAAPTGLSATASKGQVSLVWNAVAGAASYKLYWSTTSGVTTSSDPILSISGTSYVHTPLPNSTTFYYRVAAVNSSGVEGALSDEKFATTPTLIAGPTALSAKPADGQVLLSWPAVSGATSYNIYYLPNTPDLAADNTSVIETSSTNSFTHDSLANDGTTYYYLVTAVVGTVETAPSPRASAIPSATPAPAAPSGVTATSFNFMDGTSQVTVAWPLVTGATSYNIYWSSAPGVGTDSPTKVVGVLPGSSDAKFKATAGGLTPSHAELLSGTFYYVVTAVNGGLESTPSAEVSSVPPLFSTDLVSGKTLSYKDDTTGKTFIFSCATNGSLSFNSTLTGVPTSGSGTWSTTDGALTLTLPTGSLTFRYLAFSINGSLIGVSFTNGTNSPVSGKITIS